MIISIVTQALNYRCARPLPQIHYRISYHNKMITCFALPYITVTTVYTIGCIISYGFSMAAFKPQEGIYGNMQSEHGSINFLCSNN